MKNTSMLAFVLNVIAVAGVGAFAAPLDVQFSPDGGVGISQPKSVGTGMSLWIRSSVKNTTCGQISNPWKKGSEQQSIARRFAASGGRACVLTDRITAQGDALHWELEVLGEGEPWSEPIEVTLQNPVSGTSQFWTAWAAPPNAVGNWTDPLEPAPFSDCTYYYGAPAFTESEPLMNFCPTRNDIFCIPMAMVADAANDTAYTLAISPENLLLDLQMTVSNSGEVRLSFINHRIQSGKPVRLVFDVVPHPADCRAALQWMAGKYPAFFTPPNARAHTLAGCGAYTAWEGELDAAKFLPMAFRVNWKASYDFPYMGMFVPPVGYEEPYPRFVPPENKHQEVTNTSHRQMAEYSQRMKAAGLHVFNYFNVTEFGSKIRGPGAVRPNVPEGDLWKDANNFLFSSIEDGVLYSRAGKMHWTWGGAIAMDPGGEKYRAFLLEQARRHTELFPESDGICIDRMDWLRFFNPRRDDGVSWCDNAACASLYLSWHGLIGPLAETMHKADKVVFVNNHLKRLDLLRDIDGIYCEFAQCGAALNCTGLLTIGKPAIGWTGSVKDLRAGPDALFQRHLYMGVYPTAPLPGNDHTILPDPWAEKFYTDYGPMLDAIRGKQWVLRPHVVEAAGKTAKANVFRVPGAFVVPVVFAGNAKTVRVRLKELPVDVRCKRLHADFLLPGEREFEPLPEVAVAPEMEIEVPVRRGCALLRLAWMWMEPAQLWFGDKADVALHTTLENAEIRFTTDATPTPGSPLYSVPVALSKTATVSMIVSSTDEVVSCKYIHVPPCAPRIHSSSQTFERRMSVTIEPSSTKDGTIRFTTDGSAPVPDSPSYHGPFKIHDTCTVRAAVFLSDGRHSISSEATFTKMPPTPPLPDIGLETLTPVSATTGFNEHVRTNASIQDHPLTLGGTSYPRGIGTHAVSEIVYAAPKRGKRFVAVVGIDDEMKDYPEASVVFEVRADNVPLSVTPVMRAGERWNLDVKLPKKTATIQLKVNDARDGINCDHADWVNAGFVR